MSKVMNPLIREWEKLTSPPLELDLEALKVSLVLNDFDETSL